MAQYNISIDSSMLGNLLTTAAKDSSMAKLVESVLNQILEHQAKEQVGADRYERSDARQAYRNGTYPHVISTRIGSLMLRVPRLRDGKFSTELFSRYQRSEQALLLALMEMCVNGVSTRKVQNITEELCGTSFSKSMVSELTKRLEPIVAGWNGRALSDCSYPFVFVDAMVLRARDGNVVRSKGMMIAMGVNLEGYREVLGFMVGDTESEASWAEFFQWLKSRGLSGVDMLISDSHGGLVKAARKHFQGTAWQRCQTHYTRNVMEAAPHSVKGELHECVKSMLNAPDMQTARMILKHTLDTYGKKAPQAAKTLENGFEDAMTVMSLPAELRKRLRTTNALERLNEEVRRRERVIRIFPSVESATRLLGAILMDQSSQWQNGKRYLDMSDYRGLETEKLVNFKAV